MGAWRGRLVNLLVARVVGHLVDLLFAGTVAVQVLDPMVAAAGASPRHIEFTEAFVETLAAPSRAFQDHLLGRGGLVTR
jgi:hypothetical protein